MLPLTGKKWGYGAPPPHLRPTIPPAVRVFPFRLFQLRMGRVRIRVRIRARVMGYGLELGFRDRVRGYG